MAGSVNKVILVGHLGRGREVAELRARAEAIRQQREPPSPQTGKYAGRHGLRQNSERGYPANGKAKV